MTNHLHLHPIRHLRRRAATGRSQRRARRARLGVAVGLATGPLAVFAFSAPAVAMSAPIQLTTMVNLRPTPDTSQPALTTIPAGASPDYVCFTHGQAIAGLDVWFKVNYAGRTGFYASYYDNAHYTSNADLTARYGIPMCGSTPTPTPTPTPATSTASKAVQWAQARIGSGAYNGLCLTFVFDAWTAAGVNLRPYVTVPIGSNTYPDDIWGHFNHGTTGTGTPPAGALVFYRSRYGRTYSHVTLSVGGGNTISSADSLGTAIHYETVAQHASYSTYLGWWLPA